MAATASSLGSCASFGSWMLAPRSSFVNTRSLYGLCVWRWNGAYRAVSRLRCSGTTASRSIPRHARSCAKSWPTTSGGGGFRVSSVESESFFFFGLSISRTISRASTMVGAPAKTRAALSASMPVSFVR